MGVVADPGGWGSGVPDPPFHERGIDFYSGDRKMAQGGGAIGTPSRGQV